VLRRPVIEDTFIKRCARLLQSRQGPEGGRREPNPRVSPAATVPPTRTTPSTPDLNGGPFSADESICRLSPARKRSMRMQGVRRPVSSMTVEGPSSIRVPSGIRSRSRPVVVMFSPRSPAATLKPASRREAKSSDGIRWTCRRLARRASDGRDTGVGRTRRHGRLPRRRSLPLGLCVHGSVC
jgi:hypothetical protein